MKSFLKKITKTKNGNLYKYFIISLIAFIQLSCTSKVENKRIIVASAGKIESLDPAQASTLRSLQLISSLGDRLYIINSDGLLQSQLAKTLPIISNNGLTIDIPIKKGILFHDGSSFDANAMAFSIRRFMNIGTQNYVIGGRIKNIQTPDKYLLRINLNRPSSSIKGLLTSINLTPISPKAYLNHKDKFLNNQFIGTGPYKLVHFQPEKQRLEPFQKYWGTKPKNEGVDYINFRNSSSLFGAIRSGEVDILLSNSVEDGQRLALHRLAKAGKLKESIGPALEIGYITLRSDTNPFNRKVLRKAISYSINRDLITQKASYGLREPLYSIVPPVLKIKKSSPWPKYNPDIARSLLTQEGFCLGTQLTVPLTFRSNVPADKLLALTWKEQINQDLSDCLNIEIIGVEATTIYKQLSDGTFTSVILDWTGAYPDPEAYLFPLLSCERIEEGNCKKGEAVFSGSFWGESEVQSKLKASEKLQKQERLEKLDEIEKIAANGSAYIPVWLVKPRVWAQSNINQPQFDGSGLVLLNQLKKNTQ
ncbi:ABC transporter substrate-binding protein [Prochlorococcus sp. MIT 1223]|uniref:ABC transporter substrate-binding protein n=1 Tax=Prochlorococcus sp. MIT 1223 TaxID=3096217 RepID=UPI002A747F3C|nr:ABC transporter substrate-binding protein [Prochlorococcus sp. MIT 1223]